MTIHEITKRLCKNSEHGKLRDNLNGGKNAELYLTCHKCSYSEVWCFSEAKKEYVRVDNKK